MHGVNIWQLHCTRATHITSRCFVKRFWNKWPVSLSIHMFQRPLPLWRITPSTSMSFRNPVRWEAETRKMLPVSPQNSLRIVKSSPFIFSEPNKSSEE